MKKARITSATVEALRCPLCGDHVDTRGPEEPFMVLRRHVTKAHDIQGSFSAGYTGEGCWMKIRTREETVEWGDGDLQPVTRPPEPLPTLEEVHEGLESRGWSVELDEEEAVVHVEGLDPDDKYSITDAGVVYGDGPLREILERVLREM